MDPCWVGTGSEVLTATLTSASWSWQAWRAVILSVRVALAKVWKAGMGLDTHPGVRRDWPVLSVS